MMASKSLFMHRMMWSAERLVLLTAGELRLIGLQVRIIAQCCLVVLGLAEA